MTFFGRKVGFIQVGMSKEGTDPRLSWVSSGPTICSEGMMRDGCDLTAVWDEPLFCTMFSNSSTLNLVNPQFLEMWLFWNLNLAPCGGPQSQVPCSVAWCRWTWWTGQCGPWPVCPGAFQRQCAHLSGVQPGDSMPVMHVHQKGRSPRPIRATGAGHQAACPSEAAVCSHRTLGPTGKRVQSATLAAVVYGLFCVLLDSVC